jgi:hypothetical protein
MNPVVNLQVYAKAIFALQNAVENEKSIFTVKKLTKRLNREKAQLRFLSHALASEKNSNGVFWGWYLKNVNISEGIFQFLKNCGLEGALN